MNKGLFARRAQFSSLDRDENNLGS